MILLLACVLAAPHAARQPITLLGVASIAGDERDRSHLRSMVGKTPHNRAGSFGSGIDYTGRDDLYLACNDRGPGDGAADFRCRVQSLRIAIDPAADAPARVKAEIVATVLLSDERGLPLTGIASAFDDATDPGEWPRFDAEGVRVLKPAPGLDAPAGSFYLSDEYGPRIDLFGPDGRRLKRLAVPGAFGIKHPSADAAKELPPINRSGRQANRGFEGLALTPTGTRLYAVLQSPLIQDGGLDAAGKRVGLNIRILELGTATGSVREFVYPLASSKNGVSEALAVDDHRLLVLERDGKSGREAGARGLFMIDVEGATDVTGVDSLPGGDLPGSIVPVAKRLFLDLLDPALGLGEAMAGPMPEKIEGLCFGPVLDDGRRTLIVTTDNDLMEGQPTWVWVFAVRPAALGPDAQP